MRRLLALLACACVLLPLSAAGAQSGIIYLNRAPTPFSEADYDALLACTLERHPEETRRYATYHFQRRDIQTPEQNRLDPDSRLAMPVLDACFEFEAEGGAFPFSLDRLIGDWARAHELFAGVHDIASLAECAMRNNPTYVGAYLQAGEGLAPARKVRLKNMMLSALQFPPCNPMKNFTVDHDEFAELLTAAIAEKGPQ